MVYVTKRQPSLHVILFFLSLTLSLFLLFPPSLFPPSIFALHISEAQARVTVLRHTGKMDNVLIEGEEAERRVAHVKYHLVSRETRDLSLCWLLSTAIQIKKNDNFLSHENIGKIWRIRFAVNSDNYLFPKLLWTLRKKNVDFVLIYCAESCYLISFSISVSFITRPLCVAIQLLFNSSCTRPNYTNLMRNCQ